MQECKSERLMPMSSPSLQVSAEPRTLSEVRVSLAVEGSCAAMIAACTKPSAPILSEEYMSPQRANQSGTLSGSSVSTEGTMHYSASHSTQHTLLCKERGRIEGINSKVSTINTR